MTMTSSRIIQFLLVEDDPDHADLIRRAMAENRIANRLMHVPDGEAALDYLRRLPPYEDAVMPDVVLLDVRLPRRDGQEVLVEIKNDPELCEIPVAVLTTSTAEVERVKSWSTAANTYVVKPIDFGGFHRMIMDLDMCWSVWNAPPI